jgi:hypothetical protein
MSESTATGSNQFRIKDGGPFSNAWKLAAGVGSVGAVLSGIGASSNMTRFAFAYVFAFFACLTVALGAAFFVLIQRLTCAGWSVTVRRTAEFFAFGLIAMAVLAIPVIANLHRLCPMLTRGEVPASAQAASTLLISDAHALGPQVGASAKVVAAPDIPGHAAVQPPAEGILPAGHGAVAGHSDGAAHDGLVAGGHGEAGAAMGAGAHVASAHEAHDPNHIAHEETLERKSIWFARNFFYGRAFVYLAIWIGLAMVFFGYSTRQDASKDPKLTLAAQRAAPVAMMLFALSLTFAAFDWVMALEPAWFSTIFGVYVFATSAVSSLAMIVLVTMALRDAGYLKDVVTKEHYHDLGKLLFGFNVFWAYIAFSQFMLIWYAALPEETIFYHMRWATTDFATVHWVWPYLSLLLVFGHFILPFFLLLSRHSKRTHLNRLKFGAGWLLLMHVAEWYWLVLPNLKGEFSFHWLDLSCLLTVGGFYLAFVFHRMTRHPLIPTGDPRLQRSIHFYNP